MTITIIDHSPAVVDHTGLFAGIPWEIGWKLRQGDPLADIDLTGKTVRVFVAGADREDFTRDDLTGTVTWVPDAVTTAAFPRRTMTYLLVVDEVVKVSGRISILGRITP